MFSHPEHLNENASSNLCQKLLENVFWGIVAVGKTPQSHCQTKFVSVFQVPSIPDDLFRFGARSEQPTAAPTSTTTATTTSTTTTTTNLAAATTEDFEEQFEDSGLDLEDLDEEEPDEFLPTFASFSQIEPSVAEKPEPTISRSSPRFVPQPVRTVPIPIRNRNLVNQIPILNSRTEAEQELRSTEYGN